MGCENYPQNWTVYSLLGFHGFPTLMINPNRYPKSSNIKPCSYCNQCHFGDPLSKNKHFGDGLEQQVSVTSKWRRGTSVTFPALTVPERLPVASVCATSALIGKSANERWGNCPLPRLIITEDTVILMRSDKHDIDHIVLQSAGRHWKKKTFYHWKKKLRFTPTLHTGKKLKTLEKKNLRICTLNLFEAEISYF